MRPRLKVAHYGHFTPHQAGIFSTAIEMILAERSVGIDSQFIDFAGNGKPCRVGLTEDGVTTIGPSWANNADLLVRHSAIPRRFEKATKPIIMCLHGRPEYTFMLEQQKVSAIVSEYLHCAKKPNYRGYITFWKEHLPFLNFLMPDKTIDYVPAMVNLQRYNPIGEKFDWKDNCGSPNIVIADMFRADTTPFNVLFAASTFVKKYCRKGKVHIYGLQNRTKNPVLAITSCLKESGVLGYYEPLVTNLDIILRSADILVTPHIIATRVIREALASGLPIVAGAGCPYTKYTANSADTEGFAAEINRCWQEIKGNIPAARAASRKMAEDNFNLLDAGKAILPVYERVLEEIKARPIAMPPEPLKPMIYNFVAYAPSNHKKDLGWTYNKYMELLNDDDWACFIDHDAMFTTYDWFAQIEDIIAANPEYGMFSVVTNRIGNPQQKVAGLKDSHDIMYHRQLGAKARLSRTVVMDVTQAHCISGVVIIVKKGVWKKAGGFKNGFLGIDNDFHIRVAKAGEKIGIARGLYVYHFYRADDKSGLKPIETKPAAVAG